LHDLCCADICILYIERNSRKSRSSLRFAPGSTVVTWLEMGQFRAIDRQEAEILA
jgi:hypothetical protein